MTDPVPSPRPAPTSRIDLAAADTLAGYDRWSATYDETANPMVAATAWALAQHPFDVAGCDVLEAGCGTGRHAERMLAAGARMFTGVDGSRGMLEVARGRIADARVRWLEGQLHALPIATASVDRVLVVLVFEHVRELTPAFTEFARVLRPGGRLRVLEIHGDLVANGTNAHFADGGIEVRFASSAHATSDFLRDLSASGFAVERCDEHVACSELLSAVPRLGKHADGRVLVDLDARRLV